ncbi:DUF423 domain-containing protein [Pseudomaricurvus sp.]|uniref:DUF423 domain-containing protein n=1 Tax=Pseudomaricurvus sp. TaxID=2004510 RepID=UPI003F6AC09E
MAKHFLLIAGLSGLLAVMLGAFGAHGLKAKITPELLSAFQTGVQYQFYHTLALLLVALLLLRFPEASLFHWTGYAFIAGIVLFSGSLYAMAFGGPRWLGPITPLGGLCFMTGWVMMVVTAWRLP